MIENFTDSLVRRPGDAVRTRVRGSDSVQVSYTCRAATWNGVTFFANFRGTERTPQEQGYNRPGHPPQPVDRRLDVAALGLRAERRLPGVERRAVQIQAGFDVDGDGQTQGDRPPGLPITVGREDVEESLAIINALRAVAQPAAVDPELLDLEPYVSASTCA